jgi:hypothetical protein
MGLFEINPAVSPGVNAWAKEKSFKLGHYPPPRFVDLPLMRK